MIQYEATLVGLEEQLRKLGAADAAVDKHMRPAMLKSLTAIQSQVVPNWPVGVSGRSRQSLAAAGSVRVSGAGSRLTGRFGSTLREVYPAVIERGRRPGKMPPPSALYRWVQLKLGVPAGQVRGVAFAIARQIGRRGLKGKRVMAQGFQSAKPLVHGFFRHALHAITKDLKWR